MTKIPVNAEKMNYHLTYWGEVCNNDLVNKAIGVSERDFWFSSKQDRHAFKEKLSAIADFNAVAIAFAEHDGPNARKRTVAKMIMRLPDGRELPLEHDFGYGYAPSAAEYMFMDGNYSCDCNKSLLLSERYPDIKEADCGDAITLKDFAVVLLPMEVSDEPSA